MKNKQKHNKASLTFDVLIKKIVHYDKSTERCKQDEYSRFSKNGKVKRPKTTCLQFEQLHFRIKERFEF